MVLRVGCARHSMRPSDCGSASRIILCGAAGRSRARCAVGGVASLRQDGTDQPSRASIDIRIRVFIATPAPPAVASIETNPNPISAMALPITRQIRGTIANAAAGAGKDRNRDSVRIRSQARRDASSSRRQRSMHSAGTALGRRGCSKTSNVQRNQGCDLHLTCT